MNNNYTQELEKIYKERQTQIDDIFIQYSKGLINKEEQKNLLNKVDSETKQKIIHLEKLKFYQNKKY